MRRLPNLFTSLAILSALLALSPDLRAQAHPAGTVTGTIIDPATKKPVEYATITLKTKATGETVATTATDAAGHFAQENVPAGEYVLTYGAVGQTGQQSPAITVDAGHPAVDVGTLPLAGPAPLQLDSMQVNVKRETFFNTIDRKTYNVGKDIQSTTGSASDLLQNVPSVQVDIDGNVSLRGSGDVLILIDGKPSTLMGRNRADALAQLPADNIDKIEVITNPSAKYKPDGTAGIINITMKKKHDPGYSVSVRANVGTDGRYNGSVSANYNPGRLNVFGTFGLRQDYRPRTATDQRSHLDEATNTMVGTSQNAVESSRPLSHIVQTGADYKLTDDTKIGVGANYTSRDLERHAVETYATYDAGGAVVGDYDRVRTGPQNNEDKEFTATLQHTWPHTDNELNFEVRNGSSDETEDNRFMNVYHLPVATPTYSRSLVLSKEGETEVTAEGVYAVDDSSKVETGYSWQNNTTDIDIQGTFLDPVSGLWTVDTAKSNHFIYDSTINALYATYGRPFGAFGFMAGLRYEYATVDTDQRTTQETNQTVYAKFYPTLHLSYALTETGQLQLNYSRRVNRPDGEDLNPYPEYLDPFNLRAGNPHLKPEDIDSIEGGYQYKKDDISFLAALYYRSLSNGFTSVTRYINSTTLLTTRENLATSRSGGLELAATTSVGKAVSLNFSANAYRNEIDASNLGFSETKSTYAWDAKLNVNWNITKSTILQLNGNYSAKRLTPQGYRYPTSVANLGLRHNFPDKKTSLVVTVSDLFDSLHERTVIDTPTLHDDVTRRRSARIVYVGLIYNFGKTTKNGKKPKDDLQFDNQL